MSKEDEINSIERNVRDAKETKALGTALERLINNRDFRTVIKEGYFKAEAVRLVHARGDVACQTPEKQDAIIRQIDSISNLNQYFNTIQHAAGMADKAIEEGEAVLEEMRTEGAE